MYPFSLLQAFRYILHFWIQKQQFTDTKVYSCFRLILDSNIAFCSWSLEEVLFSFLLVDQFKLFNRDQSPS